MSIRNAAVAMALCSIIACSGDDPTQLDSSLEAEAPLLKKADNGGDAGMVCVKQVPASENGKAEPRTITMTTHKGECPAGFEAAAPDTPELPMCELPFGIVGECECPADWVQETVPAQDATYCSPEGIIN